MDNVSLWTKVLPLTEVQSIYNTGIPNPTTTLDLEYYFKLDDYSYLLKDATGKLSGGAIVNKGAIPATFVSTNVQLAADVVHAQAYYPFGMTIAIDGSEGYGYGFQGQEKDDEISGSGNSYTAMYWQYDSRLGRRWNTDPVVKYHESPYACFANSPIWIIDPNGADSVKVGGVWKWEVESGDTYSGVSGRTGVSVDNLRDWTQHPDKKLQIGSHIELSSPEYGAGDKIKVVNATNETGELSVDVYTDYSPAGGGRGLDIEVGYVDKGTGYTAFRWIQAVDTDYPHPAATSVPYNDPARNDDPGVRLPFYWTNAEIPTRGTKAGYTRFFSDTPQRPIRAAGTTWTAELTLVGKVGTTTAY
ncbi:RHS repeat-associated core domain-containing protein [Phaeocystidibacter marisrubri]|uniref:LysM peptidoglycan-binding domain-containing protein n=1 Tax=Phaeocystidibacter marisrubri TaxID=1577780 RepID=A0A6L3ZEX2_9FLAO|nr:RHS repeat-associated core domain-containing protein [Phaeocystidibacter marisrubri]KAB2816250.1 hypothetical protein F8C82_11220 [Phaeocystidibacter marisrubri]GGH68071.1 hypothetical protein GCM10011318_07730 [Phaeocystidibacter marisrubri]